jgi:polar amino acid transport system substrate-binding protein
VGVLRIISLAGLLTLSAYLPASCEPLPQQTPARRPSLPDRELIVATKDAAPFAMKGSDGSWQGISIDIWRHLADRLHLRYRFIEVDTVQDLVAATRLGEATPQ